MEVGETGLFTSAGSDKSHKFQLESKDSLSTRGTNRDKELWRMRLIGQREGQTKAVSLVRRVLGYPKLYRGERTSAQHYVFLWTKLKEAGIPVLPTVMVVSDNEVLETNLTANGAGIYGKGSHGKDREVYGTDSELLSVGLGTVDRRAREYAQLAVDHGIGLSEDHAFDLILQPSGDWEVMARDCKNTHVVGLEYPKESLEARNLACVDRFVTHLSETVEEIRAGK